MGLEPFQFFVQLHHFANDRQCRRLGLLPLNDPRQTFERSFEDTLPLGCALLNQRRRCATGKSVLDELTAYDWQSDQPHVDDHRLLRSSQKLPIQVHGAILQVPGHENA